MLFDRLLFGLRIQYLADLLQLDFSDVLESHAYFNLDMISVNDLLVCYGDDLRDSVKEILVSNQDKES